MLKQMERISKRNSSKRNFRMNVAKISLIFCVPIPMTKLLTIAVNNKVVKLTSIQ